MKKKLFKLSDVIKHMKEEDEDVSEEDMRKLASRYGNITYYFMHDCIYALKCDAFGFCSICRVFDRTLRVSSDDTPNLLHYNEDQMGFSIDGGYPFRHFIAHDGRLYHIREEVIVWDKSNVPNKKDFADLEKLSEQRAKLIEELERKEKEQRSDKSKERIDFNAYG